MLYITNTERSFAVEKDRCIRMELELNVSPYGTEWSHLGDHLYTYGTGGECANILIVNNYQYDYLFYVYSKIQSK